MRVQRNCNELRCNMIGPASEPTAAPLQTSRLSFYFPDAHEIRTRARALPGGDWLWAGYLLPKHTTLLTSFWKSGKTTLVSVLLSKLAAGGTFARQAGEPGRAVGGSEESGT